jgi:hypothetical protein
MANEQLPLGQIQPSARPVNTFFQSARQEPPAPARPVELPPVEGIRAIGTGGVGGYQTENKFSSLLRALEPFSAQFMKAAASAGQVYVEDQFQRGINEGLKAQRLLQGQVEQSADGYAADNRKLSRQDMPAALLMDSMNPYRRGGIQAGLAQMAAADIEPHFLSEYQKERGRLSELEPGSAEVVGFQATRQADVLRYYGLDTSMPAVQKYFIPQANKAWEKITELHWDDNQKTLKEQTPVLIIGETTALVRNARTAGVVSGYDPTTGAPVSYRLDGDSTEAANAERLLSRQVESVFDKYAKRVGISGESLPLLKKAFEELWGQSLAAEAASGGTVNNQLMRNVLRGVGIGAPVNQGDGTQRRPTAADVWGKGALDDLMKYDTAEAEAVERRRKAAVDAYEADLAAATAGIAPGPELQSAIQQVNEKHKGSGISTADMVASQTRVIPRMREIASYGMDPSAGQRVLMDLDSVPLVDFDPKAAQQRLLDALPNVPDGEKDNLLREGQAIIRRRTEEKGRFDPLVGKAVEKVVAREIAERYPNTILEMSRGGKPVDIYALRSNSNANVREAASRVESGLTNHIQSRLYEAQRKNPAMSATEKQTVINGAIDEYTNSPYFNKLFPGVGGVPNANGTPSAAPGGSPGAGGGGAGPGRPVYRGPVYSSSQLRSLGDADVKGYNQRPLLSPASLQSELNNAANGGGFSPDLQAAARRAGTTPLRFLEEQLKFNPSIRVPKEMLEDIRSRTRASSGQQAASRQVAFNPITGAQEVGNWALNLLMPAAAASEFPTSLRRPQQVATGLRQPSYTSSGGGGGGRGTGSVGGGLTNPVPSINIHANKGGYAADTGLDILGREGSDVVATLPGRIVYAEKGHSAQAVQSSSSRGYRDQHSVLVELDQPFTFKGKQIRFVWYSHLQGLDPAIAGKNGMRINAGQRLGAMGIANGVSHLHQGFLGNREQTVYLNAQEIKELYRQGIPGGSGPRTSQGGGLTGVATYYSGSGGQDGVAGGKTANGERYNPNAMTAAIQWSLRGKYLNKWVTVEDQQTGKRVKVWVNDVGPMGGTNQAPNPRDPRVIDLSPAAFRRLFGSTSRGVGRIRILEG